MKRREAHLECGREAAALTFFPERGMWREITAAVIEKRQLRGRTPNAIFMAEPQGRSAGPRPTPSNRPEMVPGTVSPPQRKGKPKGKGQMSKGKSEGDKFTADSHQPAPRLGK
jgi:hypothetical protein